MDIKSALTKAFINESFGGGRRIELASLNSKIPVSTMRRLPFLSVILGASDNRDSLRIIPFIALIPCPKARQETSLN